MCYISFFQDMLRVAQGLFQHSAGDGGLLRVNALLQVTFKLCDAGFNFRMTGAALVGGDKPFQAGVLLDGAAGDETVLLHALQKGGDAGTANVEPLFNIALVDIPPVAVGAAET